MASAAVKKPPKTFGPDDNGIVMTPREFDRADFEDGWRYELVNEVLIVSPIPSEQEVDPNEELGRLLRNYQADHPQGHALSSTLPERIVRTGKNRRRPDRVIWAGLGRLPRPNETPTVIAEFVSPGKRNRERDYEQKRDEYLAIQVKEYWIIDRFQRIMTVFSKRAGKIKKSIVHEGQQYQTPLSPGFSLDLARLLAVADRWARRESETA
jgi:Uma2 family endonuclease